jgi:hypothetical protein
MAIPNSYQQRRVIHFTTLSNLPSILKYGLQSGSQLTRLGLTPQSMDWETNRVHRALTAIPIEPGGMANDYIPLYFCKLSPMLLMILNNKTIDEQDIIHLEFPIQIIEQYPSIFTDAAIFPGSTPTFYNKPMALENLDWPVIDSTAWRMPNQKQRLARLSELLIFSKLPVTSARRIIVWDNRVAERVKQMVQLAMCPSLPIEVDPDCYFIDPVVPAHGAQTPGAQAPVPAVFGPAQIFQIYLQILNTIKKSISDNSSQCHFATLDDLRHALWENLACLPETSELVGLETDNLAHKEDVGAHTRRVVIEATQTAEYHRLDAHYQMLLDVAAFLHDIGKGPKSRWAAHDGRQQIDFNHPVRALPMLERILTREVAQVPFEDTRLICLLVAYHDIIGGVLFSGRRKEELLNIVHTPLELDLLMALSKADAIAINPAWGESPPRDRFREQLLTELSNQNPI